jgi:hypothetical protein
MNVEQVRSIRRAKPKYQTASGESVPGVTTIIGLRDKPALIGWAFNLGKAHPELSSTREYVDDLAQIGTCAHEILSAILRGTTPDLGDFTPNTQEAAKIAVAKFNDWYGRHKVELLDADRHMVSEKHRYGGTLDVFAVIDGKRTVLDFKTGKAIYPEMHMQVAAYAELLKEQGETVEQICILQIGRTGPEGFSEQTRTEWDIPWQKFLALRLLYDLEKAEERGETIWAGVRPWGAEKWGKKE